MKLFAKISAALLTVVYLLAEVGFDVHCDHQSGRNYLVLLAGGISCEKIHPDHPCCHHHHCGCSSDESCCSDIVECLQISEDVTTAGNAVPDCPCLTLSACPVLRTGITELYSTADFAVRRETSPPRAGLLRLCILRV